MACTRTLLMTALSVFVTGGVVLGGAAKAVAQSPIRFGSKHDWTLTVDVNIHAYQGLNPDGTMNIKYFEFDSAAVIFPLNLETGSSQLSEKRVVSQLTFDDQLETKRYEVLTGYHSGTRFGRWAMTNKIGREAQLRVSLPIVCYETIYDEEIANAMVWPKGDWPEDAQSTFARQMFINYGNGRDYDMQFVKNLVNKWTDGQDPKSINPAILAKWLAGQVQGNFQPSGGNGLIASRNGMLEGIELQGAGNAARNMRGTEFDMVCLLVAVYREAGLPARLVIGWDTEEEDDGFLAKRGRGELRAWAEFCLYDEAAKVTTWVPVDVVMMRKKRGNRAQDMKQTWKYFGTHDELENVIPFSFHFHPETSVRAYGTPGFWGWFVLPQAPESAYQTLRFQVITTPKGGKRDPVETDDGGSSRGRGRKRGR